MANQTGLKFLSHKGAYLIGLTNPNGQSNRSYIFIIWSYARLPSRSCLTLSHMFTYLDLPSSANSFKFSFHHLDLPLTASQTHSNPLTWTYLRVPVWLRFDFIMHAYWIGLTPLMPIWLEFEIP